MHVTLEKMAEVPRHLPDVELRSIIDRISTFVVGACRSYDGNSLGSDFVVGHQDSVTSQSHVDYSIRGAPNIEVVRFLKSCEDVEADLRAISVEAKRKHPEIKLLAEKSLLKVGDFRDRREFFQQTGTAG